MTPEETHLVAEMTRRIMLLEKLVIDLMAMQGHWLDDEINTQHAVLRLTEFVAGVRSYFNSVMLLILPKIPGLDDGVHKDLSSIMNRAEFEQDQLNAGLEIAKSRMMELDAASKKVRAMLSNLWVSSKPPVHN